MPTAQAVRDSKASKPTFAEAKHPPQLSGGLPWVGHTMGFLRDLTGLLTKARAECGDVAAIKVLGRNLVLVTGPAGQEEVFRAKDSVLSPKAAYKLMNPIFGKGVVYDCEDDRMNEQLSMLLPALQNKRMRAYSEVISSEVTRSTEPWGQRGVVDIYEFMQTLTSFTSSHCLLGSEFRNEMSEEFAHVYHLLERAIVPLAYLNAHLPIPRFRKRDRARARLGEMVSEIVNRRRASGTRGEDFMQTLMEAKYKDGSMLSEHEISGMLVAAMFAGHHTSSVTAAWAILELLQNKTWMKSVLDELESVYGAGQPIDFESIRKLEKTEWVVKEALRLHPPLFILIRVALVDTTVLGYRIPKGTWVALSPSVAHRIDSVFENSAGFCPHRYGAPKFEDKQPFAYISFGGGRHKCMGNAFALLQIKTILAHLLRNYRFELYGDKVESDFHGLVIGPKMPIRVRYSKIDSKTEAKAETESKASSKDDKAGLRPFRIVVDDDLCQGHGVCEGEAAELFELVNDRVRVLDGTPDPTLRAKAEAACEHCPQHALSLEDLPEG
ncbi:MAG: cytochrome P450 [Nannocystaceae bacterium]|nr:cytochrome P450 [Nannocystaceae bacterium]